MVMQNLQLIETPYRRTHGIPEREQEADGREGLLSSGQRFCLSSGGTENRDIRLDVEIERLALVINLQVAAKLTLTEQICERDAGSHRDILPEPLPALFARNEGLLQTLTRG